MTATTVLHIGEGKRLLIGDASHLEGPAVPSLPVVEQAKQALLGPLEFPPLEACLVDGDHVALAVSEGVPYVDQVVAGAIAALLESGIVASNIAVVSQDKRDQAYLCNALPSPQQEGVKFEWHDPEDQEGLCYAGATQAEQPLLLNRWLVEAEVAIPVSCCRATTGDLATGPLEGLFPAFSDTATRARLAAADYVSPDHEQRFASEAEEAGWMLGATIAMQVSPDLDGTADRILAGPPEVLAKELGPRVQNTWKHRYTEQVDLVVATLTTDPRQQSWTQIARALNHVDALLNAGGAVALCTDMSEELEPALASVLSSGDVDQALADLEGDASEDAAIVRQLLSATERGPVYLMSRLSDDWVEDIGWAPLAGQSELDRLIQQRPRLAVVEGAQHAVVQFSPAELSSGVER